MTEQEFRERLKCAARNDGLSAEHQAQVLARREGEEHRVRLNKKVRIALALGIVLLLGVTGAVATTSLGAVDWNGTPMLPPGGTTPPYMHNIMDYYKEPEKGLIMHMRSIGAPEGAPDNVVGVGLERDNSDSYASSVAELQAWVEAEIDEFLPWPEKLPNGYDQLEEGRVHYVGDAFGTFKLVRQEVTEDGLYLKSYFERLDDHCFMDSYTLHLLNEKGQKLIIDVYLSAMNRKNHFPVEEESSTTVLNVEGVEQVIAIQSPEETIVALRDEFNYYINYKVVSGELNGVIRENLHKFDCLIIEITATDPRLSPADLLAIFGLTAQ